MWQTAGMSGLNGLLIKLGVRLVVFGLVFWFAARKNPKVTFEKKWQTPIVALVFAVLNTALYWALRPVLDLATLGALAFAMPVVVNAILLGLTIRVFQSKGWFKVDGFFALAWMALFLTLAHWVLWVALDYLPGR
jgi:uncharacterized membrane protein YvlD (DUF360 family)